VRAPLLPSVNGCGRVSLQASAPLKICGRPLTPVLSGAEGMADAPSLPIAQKLLLRFSKLASARFLSHHDLMRLFQRAVRRGKLPVRRTEGFNPRPRIVFPHALERGVESLDEAGEIELTSWRPPREARERRDRELPPGIELKELTLLPPRRRGTRAVEAVYRVGTASLEGTSALTPARLEEFMRAPSVEVVRRAASHPASSPALPSGVDECSAPIVGEGGDGKREAGASPWKSAQRLARGAGGNRKKKRKGGRGLPAARTIDVRRAVREIALEGSDLVIRVALDEPPTPRPAEILAGLTASPTKDLLGLRAVRTELRLAPGK